MRSYDDLCQAAFGNRGFYLANCLLVAISFGAEIAYLAIIGDTVPSVLGQWGASGLFIDRRFITFMCSACVMLPLSMLKDLSQLDRTSLLSIIAVVVILFLILLHAPSAAQTSAFIIDAKQRWIIISPNFFRGIGAIAFAYVCQHSSFLVYGSLKAPSLERWRAVTHISVGFAAIMCVGFGIAGYLPFVNGVCPDVLNSFARNDPITGVARLLLAFTMLFTYPMEFFVTRHAIISVIRRLWPSGFQGNHSISDRLHYMVSLPIWLVTTALGTFSTDLGIILEITGSVAAVFLAFILPGWLRLKLDSVHVCSKQGLMPVVLVALGSIFMVVSSLLIVLDAAGISSNPPPDHCEFD